MAVTDLRGAGPCLGEWSGGAPLPAACAGAMGAWEALGAPQPAEGAPQVFCAHGARAARAVPQVQASRMLQRAGGPDSLCCGCLSGKLRSIDAADAI